MVTCFSVNYKRVLNWVAVETWKILWTSWMVQALQPTYDKGHCDKQLSQGQSTDVV